MNCPKLLTLLLLILCHVAVMAQTKVSGVVIAKDDGLPMIGATVKVEGTSLGAVTDINGRYEIKNLPKEAKSLVFSFVGYKSQTHPIASQVDVTLAPASEMLQEVVVTAMAIERQKKSLGYAVQDVKATELTQAASVNVADALQGKIAGVQISKSGGTLGASQRIAIRGNSSFGNNEPLIVVDGVPMDNSSCSVVGQTNSVIDLGNALGDINPEDIDNISVLKGGSAAIYGMRAGNGVILITTKKGKRKNDQDRMQITYDGSVTIDNVIQLPRLQNKYGQGNFGSEYTYNKMRAEGRFVNPNTSYQDFATGNYQVYDDNGAIVDGFMLGYGYSYVDGMGGGLNDAVDESWGPRLDAGLSIPQFDSPIVDGERQATPWISHPDNVRDFFETGLSQSHLFSISNSSQRGRYRASFGYTGQDGVVPNTNMRRYNFGLSGEYKFNDYILADLSLHYTHTENDNASQLAYDGTNPMEQLFQWFGRQVDMRSLKDNYKNLSPIGTPYNWISVYSANPYYLVYENTNPYMRNRVLAKGSVWITANKYLKFEGRAGYDMYHTTLENKIAYTTQYIHGQYYLYEIANYNLNLDGIAYYNRTFGNLSLNALAGANFYDNEYSNANSGSSKGSGLAIPGIYSLNNVAGVPVVLSKHSHVRSNSLYANAALDWNNQVFLEGSVRNDWHSTINRSFFYPSLSASWVLTETFQNWRSDAFNYLKLRLNWANVGNATIAYNTGNYATYRNTMQMVSIYSLPVQLSNPDLRPENINTSEAGLEAAFFDNRVRLDLAAYYKTTSDQILSIQEPVSTGYNYKLINAGLVRNMGVEVSLGVEIFRNQNGFNWRSSVNFSRDKSTVVELADGLTTYTIGTKWGVYNYAIVDHDWGTLVGPSLKYNSKGEALVDENGFPLIEQNQELGSVMPDWLMGWSNEFSYKNWSLGFLLDFRHGGKFFSETTCNGAISGQLAFTAEGDIRENGAIFGKNILKDITFVHEDGTPNTTAMDAEDAFQYYQLASGIAVVDGSFLKLREIHITYTLPERLVKKLHVVSEAKLSIVANNVAILWLHKSNLAKVDP
ncbi:MAG: SusC/RagA family TonB-linked outer membrane protein, partial [Bacteroidales bacterium]|nr:SusC/RagA family TonB-linked outer membrane protein [Candidatus Colimorpha onthohippi]